MNISRKIPISTQSIIGAGAIYLGLSIAFPLSLSRILPFTWTQLITSLVTLLAITSFSWYQIDRRIWKADFFSSRTKDCLIGGLVWLLSFPLVTLIGGLSDYILLHGFGVPNQEQVAVHYLRWARHSPFELSVALFTIILSAPIVEEVLFRGIVQTWLKNFFGYKKAIIISSLCFVIFHFSISQGLSNISIGISLFSLGCFLGFIYERQSSLFAPITLHILFNAAGVWRILN